MARALRADPIDFAALFTLHVELQRCEADLTKREAAMKRAALSMRVSTLDQHPETRLYELHQMAAQRDYRIVEEYTDTISQGQAARSGRNDA